MTDLEKAARQALDALELLEQCNYAQGMLTPEAEEEAWEKSDEAIEALRAALAQQAEPVVEPDETYKAVPMKTVRTGVVIWDKQAEPVAYCYVRKNSSADALTFDPNPVNAVEGTVFPLYAHPPQQAEPASLRPKQHDYASFVGYARALESYCDGLEQAEPVAWALRFPDDGTAGPVGLCLSTVFDTEQEAREYASKCSLGTTVVPLVVPHSSKQAEPVVTWGVDWGEDEDWVSIVKRHPDGTLEVVATEGRPVKRQADDETGNPSF
jgi:hypothetical protein